MVAIFKQNIGPISNIVDIREVEVKGKKWKLLLTNTGDVFNLKKSRLEETVGIGYI